MLVDAQPVRLRTRVRFPPPPCRTFSIEMTPSKPVIGTARLQPLDLEPTDAEWSASKLIGWNESVGDFLAEVAPERRTLALDSTNTSTWSTNLGEASRSRDTSQHSFGFHSSDFHANREASPRGKITSSAGQPS